MYVETPKIDQSFYSAMVGEDDLGVVIRAHIHVESTLIEFINAKLSDLKTLSRLRFGQRLELACELGLKPELKGPLKILGQLRNDFAHKIDAQLTEVKMNEFFNSFDKKTQTLFQEAYEASGSEMLKTAPAFLELSPKDRFTIMATILKAGVVVELSNLQTS